MQLRDVYNALKKCKFTVHTEVQEKRPDREIQLRMADIDIEVSDSQLYNLPIYYDLVWNDSKVLEITDFVKKVMKDTEEELFASNIARRGLFQWIGANITPSMGTQYEITLRCMCKEEVQID